MATMTTEKRLTKSRVTMLIKFPFFGTLALYLKLVETKHVQTAATDGKSYFYNPDFVNKLDEKEINFLTVHEVLHPALGHLWRRGNRDALIWNHAADYCINGMILESDPTGKYFKMIEGGLHDTKFQGMYSEEIYDILINDEDYVKKAKQQQQQGNGGTIDDHGVWDESPGDQDGSGDSQGSSGQSQQSKDAQADDWKGRVVQASQVAEGKNRGSLPAAIRRMIKDLTSPQKNWKQELAEFVQPEINDYGWTPPNSHHLWRDIYLPDFTEVTEMVKDLVFAIDTSGSVGSKEMKAFISEVVGCMNQFSGKVRGHLVYCDARIGAVYDLEDAERSVPVGGGGTRFEPVFEWVEENLEDCAGVVYLTDLMGSFPKEQPNYPTLWVSIAKEAEAPFGRTTYIDV